MKIGIIGYGGMAGHHHTHIIPVFNREGYPEVVEVKGVYDINPARCEIAASRGLVVYDSAEALLSDEEIKAVLVATPNDWHMPYVVMAAEHGKHVITEKPAALSSEETAKMYEAAKKNGVVFTPHQNRRWDEDFLAIKEIVENGEIGTVYKIESRVVSSNGIPGAWRKCFKQGGGMMLDWGVHLIDQALLMIDSPVKSVYCDYSYIAGEDVDDGFDLEIKFENGVIYRIVVDTNTFIQLPRWRAYGREGTAEITDWAMNGKIVSVLQRVDDQLEGIRAGNGFTKTMAYRRAETVQERPIERVWSDANAFYRNFMDAVLNGDPTTVKENQVMRVFKVMENAYRSAHENRVIEEVI